MRVTLPLEKDELGFHKIVEAFTSFRWKSLLETNNIILILSVMISLIGLVRIVQAIFGIDSASVSHTVMSVPIAVALFFMGFALRSILDIHPYDETPKWLWPVRYISLLIPASIGVYYLSVNLMTAHFNLLDLWISVYQGIPPVISILTLLLASFSLYAYLTFRREEEWNVFLINIPALIILNLSLFVAMTYLQNAPALYNFRLSFPFMIASILISAALFVGTVPFRGLMHPFASSSIKSRFMALVAFGAGLLILLKGSYNAYHLFNLSKGDPGEAVMAAHYITLSNLTTVVLAILIESILLRQTHYYHEISLYDRQLQENWIKRQALIYNIIQAIPSITLDLEEIFEKIVNELGSILQASRCVIARYDQKHKNLVLPIKEYRSSENIPSFMDILDAKWRYARDFHWIMEHISEQKQPLTFDLSFPILSDETRDVLRDLRVQSGLSCPIILQDQCFALLFIQQVKDKREWTSDDKEMVKGIADQMAIALYQAQLFAQLSESEGRFREISESNMIGIVFWNKEGYIFDANNAFLDLVGYTREEMVSGKMRLRDMTPPEFQPVDQNMLSELRTKRAFDPYEKQYIHKDGHRIDVLMGGALLENSDDSVSFTLDITEQKTTEKALKASKDEIRQLADELEQRVIERTAQLEAVNNELESFSYSISHDLRAPLRAIDGFSRAIMDSYAEKLDEKGQNYLRRICSGSQEMAQLIDDMLQLSRVSRGALKIEPAVDLSAMARGIAQELQRQEPERKVEFIIEDDLHASCDRRLVQATLQNLLDNAWKFTSKHETARIQFGETIKDGQRVYFVQDNGAGFEMAYVQKLFTAFHRLHGADEFPGTGIGLATVARIIHRHGGEIWGEGAVEKGATFYFTLSPAKAVTEGGVPHAESDLISGR